LQAGIADLIGFETLSGFWLLLLIPILLLFQHRRSTARRLFLTTYPLMTEIMRTQKRPAPRILRLVRHLRSALTAIAIVCLCLVFNGTYLILNPPEPGDWLIVIDNIYTQNHIYKEESLIHRTADAMEDLVGRLGKDDRISIMATAPEPHWIPIPDSKLIRERLRSLQPSPWAGDVTVLADYIKDINLGENRNGTIVLSPRAERWRDVLSNANIGGPFIIPPDLLVERGNAGIVAFDLRPSPDRDGQYDLFFRVENYGPRSESLVAILKDAEGYEERIPLTFDFEGKGRFHLTGIPLSRALVTLSLISGDSFELDDLVIAQIREQRQIDVRFIGDPHPFLLSAVSSHDRFNIVSRDDDTELDAVDLFVGEIPTGDLKNPTLVILPPGDFLDISLDRIRGNPDPVTFNPTHFITRHLPQEATRPSYVVDYDVPPHYEVIARTGERPLIIAGSQGENRFVLWAFDPMDSGIFLDPSFIVLLRNSLEWISNSEDVQWHTIPGCLGNTDVIEDGLNRMDIPRNVLCSAVTRWAETVSVTDVSKISISLSTDTVENRINLKSLLLIIAG
jgi:hypothetical protein